MKRLSDARQTAGNWNLAAFHISLLIEGGKRVVIHVHVHTRTTIFIIYWATGIELTAAAGNGTNPTNLIRGSIPVAPFVIAGSP